LNTNDGTRQQLQIAGRLLGRHLTANMPVHHKEGSCIAVVATDLPLHPSQLRRLARRVDIGLGRTGSVGNDGSGEIFLAFSTAQRIPRAAPDGILAIEVLVEGQFWTQGSARDILRDNGITIITGAELHHVEDDPGSSATVYYDQDGNPGSVPADAIPAAMVRQPVTADLVLDQAGVRLTNGGAIAVDEHLRTSPFLGRYARDEVSHVGGVGPVQHGSGPHGQSPHGRVRGHRPVR
jgi:hypothetical protein